MFAWLPFVDPPEADPEEISPLVAFEEEARLSGFGRQALEGFWGGKYLGYRRRWVGIVFLLQMRMELLKQGTVSMDQLFGRAASAR
ncbi:MAG: hypothetical protein Ct9H300mP8_05130 [Gammaproteobacteria bacterium]|nr:MAG: hypothetical protein Ct9H300mP8_05130 [Gammaproteobacteria bacterium]